MEWKQLEGYPPSDPNFRYVSALEDKDGMRGALWYSPKTERWVYGCSYCDDYEHHTDSEESAKAMLLMHVRMECDKGE